MASVQPASRTVYVWFGGLGTKGDQYGYQEKDILVRNGIASEDVVVHRSPFPYIPPRPTLAQYFLAAGPLKLLQNLKRYMDWSNPHSHIARNQHQALLSELHQAGVKRDDRLVFIGHSAGAEAACTEAAEMTTDDDYHVDQIVSLGGPFVSNYAPRSTYMVVVESPQDELLHGVEKLGFIHRVPRNFSEFPHRLHITLAPQTAQGEVNNHGSYLWEHNLPRILQEAAHPHSTTDVTLPA